MKPTPCVSPLLSKLKQIRFTAVDLIRLNPLLLDLFLFALFPLALFLVDCSFLSTSIHSTSVGSFRHRFATALSVPFDIDSVHLRTGSFRHRFRVDPNLGRYVSNSFVILRNRVGVCRFNGCLLIICLI